MPIKLASPIAAYFVADRGTPEAVAQCFAPEAIVKDEGHTYCGIDAIRNWRAEVATKYTYTCEPLLVEQEGDATVVTCRLEGNFPGSPVNLRFFFQVLGEKIVALEVMP